jgi:hypothetical protein
MRAVTDAWTQSRDGKTLIAELEKRGFLLARGDRRSYVVVDRFGEIHSLARQISGVRARDVKARLADYPVEKLPDAKKAQAFARQQRESAKQTQPPAKQTAQERRAELSAAHEKRRAEVERKHEALKAQHQIERETLKDAQGSERKGVVSARLRSRPKGVIAFLSRITGIKALVKMHEHHQDKQRAESHRLQREALARRHARERQDFDRHFRALDKVETRERRSLETQLRREEFARIARGPGPVPPRAPPGPGPKPLTPAFQDAAAPTEPRGKRTRRGLSPVFEKSATGAGAETGPDNGEGKGNGKERGGDTGGPSLTDEFKRALKDRAAKKRKDRERDKDKKRRGPGGDRGL